MRPVIEALNEVGRPHLRQARVVDDLPGPEERRAALELATMAIARQLGIPAVTKIGFGSPAPMATPNCSTVGQSNCSRQDGVIMRGLR